MYSLIVYQTITNPYMRLVRVADGGIVAAADWSISITTAWGDSDIALTKNDLIGGIPVIISKDLEAGDYDLLIYDSDTPAEGQVPLIVRRIAWMGEKKLVAGVPITPKLI